MSKYVLAITGVVGAILSYVIIRTDAAPWFVYAALPCYTWMTFYAVWLKLKGQ